MPDEVKLLPCPFDGGQAEQRSWEVSCTKCGVTLAAGTTAEAIERWNTRPTLVTDEVVERRAVLDALHHRLEYPTEACAIVRSLPAAMPTIVQDGGE